ncbi:MAG: hypothetical protein AAF847_17650, partial [Bacteroidota bacterium]
MKKLLLFTVGMLFTLWLHAQNCENDTIAPTPICKVPIEVNLSLNGTAQLQAAQFDAGSFDDCSSRLRFSFSADTLDVLKTITATEAIELWVTDEAGNQDFCASAAQVASC